MIVITGGAGFIGANLVAMLNARGDTDLVVVDDLTDGTKFRNLADASIADYLDKDEFLDCLAGGFPPPRAIVHLGACSDTTEWNGRYMMDVNYRYSRTLHGYCAEHGVPFIYASSASVYGGNEQFTETPANEAPLNVYGWSKLLFDQYVRRNPLSSQVVGLRFFNVYGPREFHKGSMASVALHLHRQLGEGDEVRLFEGTEGYGDGQQERDFVYVADACDVMSWFLANPAASGIFNVGTGRARPFNAVAESIIAWHGRGRVSYVPFPEHLRGRYQSHTRADLTALRAAGYPGEFRDVPDGVGHYLDWLAQRGDA